MLAIAISTIGMSISLAVLVFSGPMADGLPRATSAFIVAGGLVAVVTSLRSSFVPAVAIAQDGPTIVFVALVANLVDANAELQAQDVFVLAALAAAVTGVVLFLLGWFGAGSAVRFLPTTVVSGFVAGTGWLLFKGGHEVMIDGTITRGTFGDMFGWDVARFWLPGLVLGLVVLALTSMPRVPVVASSAAVVVAVVAFFVVVLGWSSIDAVEGGGWLVGPFGDGSGPQLVSPSEVADAPWADFARETGGVVTLLLVSAVALLLNLSGLESVTKRRLDLDHELRVTGIANLVVSPLGSVPAFHALGDSVLATRMGATRRVVPATAALLSVGFGLFGTEIVGLVPRFVAGGLLIAVGSGLLLNWFRQLSGPVAWPERLLSAAVLLVIATIGILEGVTFGLIVACGVFVVRYSRVDPVRRASTGLTKQSRVDRTDDERTYLAHHADRTRVFELQGFLFFGSIIRLVDAVSETCLSADDPVDDVILECRFVTGIDAGALTLLDELIETLYTNGTRVALSVSTPSLAAALGSLATEPALHPSLDAALAIAEDRRLSVADLALDSDRASGATGLPDAVLGLLASTTVEAGTLIIERGQPSDSLLYMVSGRASVFTNAADGSLHRLRQLSGPSWLGEIGFLRRAPRSADVIADTSVELVSLERDEFERMRDSNPELIIAILDDIAMEISDRAASLSDALARALD